jgi:putative transposase
MPYCARKHQLQYALAYHIYNRSNARMTVFHTDSDCRYFMELLREYVKTFNLNLYHWVIMPNHYHLLLELEQPEQISKVMAGLNRSYTCYYHRVYQTAGFLWQGRFKCQPVQKEGYLFACGRYIERNPVRADIVSKAQEYAYSSAGFYCAGKADGLTTEDPIFSTFGPDMRARMIRYARFLRAFDAGGKSSFANFSEPQGSEEFISKLIKENGRYLPKRRGRPRQRIVS